MKISYSLNEILNTLALLNYRKGNFKSAKEYFKASYNLDKNYDAYNYLDVLFQDKSFFLDYYLALDQCEKRDFSNASIPLIKISKKSRFPAIRIIYLYIKYRSSCIFKKRKILKE